MYISAQIYFIKFHSSLATCTFRYQADGRIQHFQALSTFSVLYPENTSSWLSAFTAPSIALFQINHKLGWKLYIWIFVIHTFKCGRYSFLKEIWILCKNTNFFSAILRFSLTSQHANF